jgi:hypothetical protein
LDEGNRSLARPSSLGHGTRDRAHGLANLHCWERARRVSAYDERRTVLEEASWRGRGVTRKATLRAGLDNTPIADAVRERIRADMAADFAA